MIPNIPIEIGFEQPYEPTQKAPSIEAVLKALATEVRQVDLALELANRIRSKGYRAEFFHPISSSTPVLAHPYFVDAGLGQMGTSGQLLPPYAGSRIHLLVITTDTPVICDEPMDYGIPKFCFKCQVCVQRYRAAL